MWALHTSTHVRVRTISLRKPSILYPNLGFRYHVVSGGLISYRPDTIDQFRCARVDARAAVINGLKYEQQRRDRAAQARAMAPSRGAPDTLGWRGWRSAQSVLKRVECLDLARTQRQHLQFAARP